MKTALTFIVVVVISIASMDISYPQSSGDYNRSNLNLSKKENFYRCDNLQLYPIHGSVAFLNYYKKLGPYLSLQEAMTNHKILVTEVGRDNDIMEESQFDQLVMVGGAEVNTLFVENISADTILILGGEVVRGGKQDRMIAQDFLLFPGSGKVDISVFCVEHGRWTAQGDDMSFNVTLDMAPAKVRKAGTETLNQKVVWEEVEDIVMREDIKITTGALAHAVETKAYIDRMKKYEECFTAGWPETVVGVIAIVGSEIVGGDIFASHTLFEKYFPCLLNSYSSEAAWKDEEITVKRKDVEKYLDDILKQSIPKDKVGAQTGKYRLHVSALE